MRLRRIASTPAGWVFSGLAVLLAVWFVHWIVVSSDIYRTGFFRWHKGDFEAVHGMLDHDRSTSPAWQAHLNSSSWIVIDCDGLEPAKLNISSERMSEYRQRLSQLGCPTVSYLAVAEAFNASFSWDINQASDIMFIPGHPKLSADGYGHIEGDWYLAYR